MNSFFDDYFFSFLSNYFFFLNVKTKNFFFTPGDDKTVPLTINMKLSAKLICLLLPTHESHYHWLFSIKLRQTASSLTQRVRKHWVNHFEDSQVVIFPGKENSGQWIIQKFHPPNVCWKIARSIIMYANVISTRKLNKSGKKESLHGFLCFQRENEIWLAAVVCFLKTDIIAPL